MTTATADAARAVRRPRALRAVPALRTVRLQVPDTRAPGFDEECRRQCRRIAAAFPTGEDAAWERIAEEAMADMDDWTA